MVSLDGYYEGENHDLYWHNTDEEFADFAYKQLDDTDILVFGRKTYEVMSDYWPSKSALSEDPQMIIRMNKLHKIVFSHHTFNSDWENTEVSTNLTEKIKELSLKEGKNIAVLGSSHLGKELIEADLVDEIRIMINPVFIGNGSALFEGLNKHLTLTSSRTFRNGNVLLVYKAI